MRDDFGAIPNLQRALSARSQFLEGIAQRLLQLAKSLAPNNHVRSAISVEEIGDSSGGKVSITLKADRNIAPDARAYEYGSGVHSRRSETSPRQLGPKGKILITPRPGTKALVFPWDVATVGIPRTKDGKVILQSVEHPGVEPANNGEGYLRKAVKDSNKQNRSDVRSGVAIAVKLDLKEQFGRIGKK